MKKVSLPVMKYARIAMFSVASVVLLSSCSSVPTAEESLAAIKSSFNERGIAKLDRLDQTEIQRICSEANMAGKEVDKKLAEKIRSLILPGAEADAIHGAAIEGGMVPITQAAVRLARAGTISLSEAWRVRAD